MLASKLRMQSILPQLKNQRVLMRADFNVPVKEGVVTDSKRIKETLPSIQMALDQSPKSLVLMSHLGRPNGMPNSKYTLRPVANELEKLLGREVLFLSDCVGPHIEQATAEAKNGSVILLENLRFHGAEEGSRKIDGKKEKEDKETIARFRKSLTSHGDIYINDAFGTSHRAHSSVVGVDLPTRAAGQLLSKELDYFSKVLEKPDKPLLIILGGAKVSDKIQLISNLLDKCDEMIIGGAMAFTFKKVVTGHDIGSSLFDEEGSKLVPDIMKKAQEKGVKIHLPVDFKCAETPEDLSSVQEYEGDIPMHLKGFDIGQKSLGAFGEAVQRAGTVFWNGPMGMFEVPEFRTGSEGVFKEILARSKRGNLVSVVGGGDTGAFVSSMGSGADCISHISTGGGASLELMEGKVLPGVQHLSDASK